MYNFPTNNNTPHHSNQRERFTLEISAEIFEQRNLCCNNILFLKSKALGVTTQRWLFEYFQWIINLFYHNLNRFLRQNIWINLHHKNSHKKLRVWSNSILNCSTSIHRPEIEGNLWEWKRTYTFLNMWFYSIFLLLPVTHYMVHKAWCAQTHEKI